MLRWLLRLLIVGLVGLGVAYAVSRLMGQDEDFDDFDDIEAGFDFQETPVEIDVPAESGATTGSLASEDGGGGSQEAAGGSQNRFSGKSSASGDGGGSLIDITGIGPNYAARLEAAGITSINDLANANAEDLASRIDVIGGASSIEDWIAQAKSMGES